MSLIGSGDPNIIPAYKALEIFIEKIVELPKDGKSLIVTGYPRNMRDVVEYLAQVGWPSWHKFTTSYIGQLRYLKPLDQP